MSCKVVFAAALLGFVFLALLPSGDADCCGYWYEYKGSGNLIIYRCADCTRPDFKYCGYRSCNIFGCNCNCRKPVEGRKCASYCCDRSDRKARDVDDQLGEITPAPFAGNYTGHDVISFIDNNKDGRLDELEVKIFVTRHGLPDDDSWRALDVDGDNHLSAHEIDGQLMPGEYVVLE